MSPQVRYICLFLGLFSLFLQLKAQYYENTASLGRAPVAVFSRVGANGDRESISSLGGAQVGFYRRSQPFYPVPQYPVPQYPVPQYPKPKYPVPVKPTRRPVPKYPVVKPGKGYPPPTKKPLGVSGRIAGGLLGGGGGGGLLGGGLLGLLGR